MLVEGVQLCVYVFAVFHVHRKRDTAAMIFAAWCKSHADNWATEATASQTPAVVLVVLTALVVIVGPSSSGGGGGGGGSGSSGSGGSW